MGEKFAANPVTGTGATTVPIATSPGRSGFGPELSLSYDSAAGNGPFGFGWNITLPAITRRTDKGLPLYRDAEESDVYIVAGAEDLVPVLLADGTRFKDDRSVAGYVIHQYRPRVEGLFARIERWTNADTGAIHWRTITRDNVTTLYGKDLNSRVFDPADPTPANSTRIFSWLVCETYDDKGNAVVYEYAPENDDNVDRTQLSERNRVRSANRYLKRIKYGNRVSRLVQPDLTAASWLFEVVFDYDQGHYEAIALDPARPASEQHQFVRAAAEEGKDWANRPDPFSSHRSGFEVRTHRRCRRVLMFHHIPDLPTGEKGCEGLVRSTEFEYDDIDYSGSVLVEDELTHQGSTRFASFIRHVTQSGYVRDESRAPVVRNGVEYATYLKKSLPPIEFEYSKARIQEAVQDVDRESLENLPAALDGSSYQLVDLHGEGAPGILTEQANAWFFKRNLSPLPVGAPGSELVQARFAPVELVGEKPGLALAGEPAPQFMDIAGDGKLDLVVHDGPAPGLYELDAEHGWSEFRAFASRLNRSTRDPNLKFVDLDGDGQADVLITENDALVWHRSLGEVGFGPAHRVAYATDEDNGARLVFADGMQSIYLADMCGDGLADLVRIRCSEVCYWPNLGYGRFGPKITMDGAPLFDSPDAFDQRRVRLADIDGSGTTDIIYLHRDGVRIYFNQSGNRLSTARRLTQFPPVDDLAAVVTADLLGNGTACLVWSSPLPGDARRPIRYVDLMGGSKPHLLTTSINNLGTETRVQYVPSTKFYLADRNAGKSWVSRLPYPVHVVERVVTHDAISGNRFVTRYAYHHGYFDGVEREFRGFGMVEQWDTEEFAVLEAEGHVAAASNLDAASHIPPVLTKTWFHTGMYVGRGHVSDLFSGTLDVDDRGEYYREPGLNDLQARALLLDDTPLPDGLTVEEEREACRALKGSMLRQEIYALDRSDKQAHPYSVTEQNFTVSIQQRRRTQRHGVFFTHARESLRYHYERNPADPRVEHALTLEVDPFGNVLRSATIAYGRRQPDLSLAPAFRSAQSEILITCLENRVTNRVDARDDYRVPVPCESRTSELTGLALNAGRSRFTFDDVLDAVSQAYTLNHEEPRTPGRVEKRTIKHARTYFRSNDLTGALPLATQESLALPFQSCELAFTPGLITNVFGNRVTDAMLSTEGGYIHTENEGGWWMPSGQVFYSPIPDHPAGDELTFARGHFFLPHRYRDPFHTSAVRTESVVTYDRYDLLLQETRDPLGNRVTVGERHADPLQPPVRRAHDYRVLQPSQVMDPNRNRSEAVYDAFGLLAGTALMGKPEDPAAQGDRLTAAFHADLTQAEIDQFVANPRGAASAALLDSATTRNVYDTAAYWRNPAAQPKRPAFSASLVRETHASDPLPSGGLRMQVSFSYSDGFGREIQKKMQAEPGPSAPRWVGSGWTVFNNKGKPVRQYQPFFTDTHRFEFDARIGVTPVLLYDPVERVVATLHPNHTWEKTIFDSWTRQTWDANDTAHIVSPADDADVGDAFARLADGEYLPTWYALRTDPAHATAFSARYPDARSRQSQTLAAGKTGIHARTPAVIHTDSLGRTFLTIAHNKFKYTNTPPADPPVEQFHSTRMVFDIDGNQREVVDAAGRQVVRYDYDLLNTRIHQASMEAGERWMLNDVSGNPLYAWDSRGHRFRTMYDALRRPTRSLVRAGTAAEMTVGRTIYGESRANPETVNVRGQAVEVFDQAGIVTTDRYDFKGNLLVRRRRLADVVDPQGSATAAYQTTVDWSRDIQLRTETYTSSTRYDALNRPVLLIAPHSDQAATRFNFIQPSYNDANLLEQVHLWVDQNAEPAVLADPVTATVHAITRIDYDAKGQRKRVERGTTDGSTIRTDYTYEPETFRLTHLVTERTVNPQVFQDLHYTYDASGNVVHLRDDAQHTIYFRNTRVEPSAEYTYDALYRLIEAAGREQLGQIGGPSVPHSYNDWPRATTAHPGDGDAMRRYLERYLYDATGNLQEMQHHGSDLSQPDWTRTFHFEEASQREPGRSSNRLTRSSIDGADETFSVAGNGYDVHGHMLRMPHLQLMQWTFDDRLQMTRRQAVNAADVEGTPRDGERTWYVYDSAGRRVRKVTENANGSLKDERLYLEGLEIYRRYGIDPLLRESLPIMDDDRRVALVEMRTAGNDGSPARLVRYEFSNDLRSVALELDDRAEIISYEEYTPYGATSYQAARSRTEAAKRYRFTGNERDEESGLYHHGARYYAPWLARWVSADPAGLVEGTNLYAFAKGNPANFYDDNGLYSKGTTTTSISHFVKAVKKWTPEAEKHERVTGSKAGGHYEGKGHTAIRVFDHDFREPQTANQFVSTMNGKPFSYRAGFLEKKKTDKVQQKYIDAGLPIDVEHFFRVAALAQDLPDWAVRMAYVHEEVTQTKDTRPAGRTSAFAPEDLFSNELGLIFGTTVGESSDRKLDFAKELGDYLKEIQTLFTTNQLKGGKYLTADRIQDLRDIAQKYYGTTDLTQFGKGSKVFNLDEIKKINDNAAVGNYPFYNNKISADEFKKQQAEKEAKALERGWTIGNKL
jgi:RHS repeat-associated protein